MSKSRAEVNSYFHGPVDRGHGNSAEYVIAHSVRQRQRGRNPSVPYKDITNPSEALRAAHDDVEARSLDANPFGYTEIYSGRVAVMHVWNEYQKVPATSYANARIDGNRAAGAIISVLQESERPPHMHATEQGTVELTYHYN
jgi:hypothetical protein